MNDNFNRVFPSNSDRLYQQNAVAGHIGEVLELLGQEPVAPKLDVEFIRASIQSFDFNRPEGTVSAAKKIVELMKGGMVHMMHPGYFGLFNPTTIFPGIVADLITASLNPQLAVWSHAAVPVEIERRVMQEVGTLFDQEFNTGHFTSGAQKRTIPRYYWR